MFVAKMLPGVLFGSVAGVFVDRWDRRRTMVFANLLMALSMLPLLAVPSTGRVWIVYAVAFAESSVAAFFRPAENSLLPRLVEERHLMVANSLNVLNNNLARLVGPALGGLAVGLLGLGGVALLNAASYLIAAAMISLITGRYRPLGEPST
jgi:predicted MFS family arabinose efflux permease